MHIKNRLGKRSLLPKSQFVTPDGRLDERALRAAVPTCLQCNYDLSGLTGMILTCPECGVRHDLPAIIARLHIGDAIGRAMVNQLTIPLAFLVVSLILIGLSSIRLVDVFEDNGWLLGITIIGAMVVIAVIWLLLLIVTARNDIFGGGLRSALLLHAVFAGYFAGVLALPIGLILLIAQILETRTPFGIAGALIFAVGGGAIWWGAARLYRTILAGCIASALTNHEHA